MAVDFDPPPTYDALITKTGMMSDSWSAHSQYSWQTLTSYITKDGFFLPPVTTAQRDALQSPTDGQIIYNTTLQKAQLREGGSWKTFVTV